MAKLGTGAACCGQPDECEIECDLTTPDTEFEKPSPAIDDEDETDETEEDDE